MAQPLKSTTRRHELTVARAELSLAGTLWLPAGEPGAVVLMHPGSGPSDRDNDVYFPPIREHLLGRGIAVCSFDKRGVGGSTGRWTDAGIVEQADDTLACLEHLLGDERVRAPVGLFGHSQGGWVVVEAASRSEDVAFVVPNAGPGVSPGEQERWAARTNLARADLSAGELEEANAYVDQVLVWLRSGAPFDEVRSRVDSQAPPAAFDRLGLPLLPDDAATWDLFARIIDYDPRLALERIRVPVLALFGAEDRVTPVEESVAAYQAAVRPELLTVRVFEGGDHRVLAGDPPRLVDGYLEALSAFVEEAAAARRV
jgi:pimeloyl-ACP methyl ester carboxylesterase